MVALRYGPGVGGGGSVGDQADKQWGICRFVLKVAYIRIWVAPLASGCGAFGCPQC